MPLPDTLFLTGLRKQQQGDLPGAVAIYRQILVEDPHHPAVLTNLAMAYHVLLQPLEAEKTLRRALKLHPQHVEALNGLGIVLSAQRRYTEAVGSYRSCVVVDPSHDLAWHNLGLALSRLEEMEQAVSAFQQALAIAPNRPDSLTQFIFHKLQICDWSDDLDQAIQRLRSLIGAGTSGIDPFVMLFICHSPAELQRVARIHSQTIEKNRIQGHGKTVFPTVDPPPQRLRLAYLSADFHSHATALLAAELFESHDRERFETFAYSLGPEDHSAMRERLMRSFDHFLDVKDLADDAIAQRIREDGIQILVDLKGYTRDARPGILARRPVPVQINYLGFPGTMGASFMDYIVADSTVLPCEQESFFDEKPIRLPYGYQVNDTQRAIARIPLSRSSLGLPEKGMVFCCFNQSIKITPEFFAIWLRLLKRLPGSVLWLLAFHPHAMERLRRMADAAGVDPRRLVFASRLSSPEHLARYRVADLFLDTLPCGAHTTASDALWGGCPVLTCQGTTFSGRVAASLLIHLGLPELVVQDLSSYERLAWELARDRERLERLKERVRLLVVTSPVFDGRIFARYLEKGLLAAWKRFRQGQPPGPIEITYEAGETARFARD
ncbi:MAG: tetratricopeptide repeat protein [Magnetococcales bacterium]|nr:tetratricopeptide repeat protein [Magnetococcales bacterium]